MILPPTSPAIVRRFPENEIKSGNLHLKWKLDISRLTNLFCVCNRVSKRTIHHTAATVDRFLRLASCTTRLYVSG